MIQSNIQINYSQEKQIFFFNKGCLLNFRKYFNKTDWERIDVNNYQYDSSQWSNYFYHYINYDNFKCIFKTICIYEDFRKDSEKKAIDFFNNGKISKFMKIYNAFEDELNLDIQYNSKLFEKYLDCYRINPDFKGFDIHEDFFEDIKKEIELYINSGDIKNFIRIIKIIDKNNNLDYVQSLEKIDDFPINLAAEKKHNVGDCSQIETSFNIDRGDKKEHGVIIFGREGGNETVNFLVMRNHGRIYYFFPLKNYQIGKNVFKRSQVYTFANYKEVFTKGSFWNKISQKNYFIHIIKAWNYNLKDIISKIKLDDPVTLQLVRDLNPEDLPESSEIHPLLKKVLFTEDIEKILEE